MLINSYMLKWNLVMFFGKTGLSHVILLCFVLLLLNGCKSHDVGVIEKDRCYFFAIEKNKERGRLLYLYRNGDEIQLPLPDNETCSGPLMYDKNGDCYVLTAVDTGSTINIDGKASKVFSWSGLYKVVTPQTKESLSSYKIDPLLTRNAQKLSNIANLIYNKDERMVKPLPVVSNIKYVSPDGKYLILELITPRSIVDKNGETLEISHISDAIFFIKSKKMSLISD